MKIKCEHCNQWGDAFSLCRHCGAPIGGVDAPEPTWRGRPIVCDTASLYNLVAANKLGAITSEYWR